MGSLSKINQKINKKFLYHIWYKIIYTKNHIRT
jgi:hypothetical protein